MTSKLGENLTIMQFLYNHGRFGETRNQLTHQTFYLH